MSPRPVGFNRTIRLTEKAERELEERRRLRLYPDLDPRDWPEGDWLTVPVSLLPARVRL